jgi:hypothetical protein
MQPRPAQNTPRPWSSLSAIRALGAKPGRLGTAAASICVPEGELVDPSCYTTALPIPSSTTAFPSSIPGALANASVPSPLPPTSTENQAADWLAGRDASMLPQCCAHVRSYMPIYAIIAHKLAAVGTHCDTPVLQHRLI